MRGRRELIPESQPLRTMTPKSDGDRPFSRSVALHVDDCISWPATLVGLWLQRWSVKVRGVSRPLPLLLIAGLVVFPVAAPVWAQAPETGVIEGRVQNAGGGRFLNNARVTIVGTNLEAFTNAAGEYRLPAVPAGTVQVRIFYTGLEEQTASVQVPPGGVARQDFRLNLPGAAAGERETVVMDQFLVAGTREYNAEAIAINEQRFAPNLKNVVSTDAFGEINQGNIGEFLKHVPGVSVELKDGNSPSGIQVRGFNSNFTNVTLDGGQLASAPLANTSNHTRQFVLEQANINNLARIEVVKLPTPELSANTLGGSVNLISKSAFEYEKPELNVTVSLSGNSEDFKFSKTPGPGRKETYKVRPSVDLRYALPINNRLGFVFTAAHSDQYSLRETSVPLSVWTERGAAVDNPYRNQFRSTITPMETIRTSYALMVDWKPAPRHLLQFSTQLNQFEEMTNSRTVNYNIGNGVPQAWGETFTRGAATGASVSVASNLQYRDGETEALFGKYTFTGDQWKVEAAANWSSSTSDIHYLDKGFFSSASGNVIGVGRIDFDDIDNFGGTLGSVTVYDPAGNVIDETAIENRQLLTVNVNPQEGRDVVRELRFSVARDLDALPFPVTLKAGASTNHLRRTLDYTSITWTYLGPDGVANSGDEHMTPYLYDEFSGTSPGAGFKGFEWASPYKVADAFNASPGHFMATPAQEFSRIQNEATRSTILNEWITAGFLMADVKLLDNRLRLVGGVRYELTEDSGRGPLTDQKAQYVTDANGEIVKDAGGNPIRLVPANTPEAASLVYTKNGRYSERDYHGYYPSLHGTYNVTESLIVRAAYAKTIGRPRLRDIVPNISINPNLQFDENVSGSLPGTITESNTGLRPWEANNYDVSVEYYLPRNGVISAGYFYKDISDFHGNLVLTADAELLARLELTDEYLGYRYTTRTNQGDAKIKGYEFNYSQPLDFLGEWGRRFSVMANYTRLQLSGSRTADFSNFIPKSANLGLRYSTGRFSIFGKWNYRGAELREPKDDYPDAAEYIRSRVTIDASVEYRITGHLALFVAGRNLTNTTNEWEVSGPGAPDWSWMTSRSTYGAQYSFGVKGAF